MPGTAHNTTQPEATRRDLAPAADISQDEVTARHKTDAPGCECDDCDCPVCYPGCC